MKKLLILLITIISQLLINQITFAQGVGKLVVPCAVPFYRELDFTVGEWQVFDKSTGKLAGYDRIGRTLRGCAIQQSWISLDDHFSSEYVPFRMNGKSLTAFDGSKWVQFWVDNQAGVQILKGGPEKEKFVLRSEENVGNFEYMLTWQRQDDGSLLNVHQRREIKGNVKGEWEILYEWVYVKNLNQNLYPEDEDDDSN